MKESIAILGMGRVGTAVGFLLRSAGYRVVAVASRSFRSAEKGIAYTGGKVYDSLTDAASQAECVFITTADDAIASVCEEISEKGGLGSGKKVIHMSGAGKLDLLESARRTGSHIASIHPIQSFATVEGAVKNIPGSAFGVTAEEVIRDWTVQVVRDLGGVPFFVLDADRPLYHAAACMASNYLVVLMHMVEEVYKSVGVNRDNAISAFWPLVNGTMNNIKSRGTVQSLTGPISRGDIETVKKHIEAFRDRLPDFLDLYNIMGSFAVDIGLENKTLTNRKAEEIRSLLLEGGFKDE